MTANESGRVVSANGGTASSPVAVAEGAPRSVLVVDDEESIRTSLRRMLGKVGYEVHLAPDGREALDVLRREKVNVILTDMVMPRMGGIDLLKTSRTVAPDTEVVMMTAHGTVDAAVEAMREGAYDFITKPLKRAQILKSVEKALERQALLMENQALRAELTGSKQHGAIIGNSLAIRRTWTSSTRQPPARPPCWSWERAVRARSCWPGRSTGDRTGATARSSR